MVIVRPAYFQEDWVSALEDIEAESSVFYAYLTPLQHLVAMVSAVRPAKAGTGC